MSEIKFHLNAEIICRARNKKLNKNWWQINANKLAFISLQTQTIFKPKSKNLYFSLAIVSNKQIQELNNIYRNLNKPTDVLSFPSHSDDLNQANLNEIELGDIIISLEKVKEQAEEYNHSLEREAAFLFVHGFLHLLGYDHETDGQEREMFALQDKILEKAEFRREHKECF